MVTLALSSGLVLILHEMYFKKYYLLQLSRKN